MKRLLWLIGILIFPAFASAQGFNYSNVVTGPGGQPVGGATITVCNEGATGLPCTSLATIYSNVELTTPKDNPFTSDGKGNFSFYLVPGNYRYTITRQGLTPSAVDITVPCVPDTTNPNCGTGGSPPGGVNGDVQTKNGSAFAGGTQLSVLSHKPAARNLTPSAAGSICYVAGWGSDSNDGLSWGSAKLTIMDGCYDTMANSGGNIGGTIYIAQGGQVVAASTNANCGIWIMGPNDPNYASPPTCWRKEINAVHFVGSTAYRGVANFMGGNQADNWHPSIWLSATSSSILFENMGNFDDPNAGTIIGCDSNHACSTTAGGVSGPTFRNMAMKINNVAGAGPNVRIGNNSFWIFFEDSAYSGNSTERAAITSVSRTSNFLTVTLTAPLTLIQYQHLGISDATDQTVNSSYQVSSVIDSTHFTVHNYGPDMGSTSVGGTVFTDKWMAMDIDPWDGNTVAGGSGLIYVSGQSGGTHWSEGMRLWPGGSGGSVFVDGITFEAPDFDAPMSPGVWVSDDPFAVVDVRNSQTADCGNRCVVLRVDNAYGNSPGGLITVSNVQGGVDGPAQFVGTPQAWNTGTSTKTPLSKREFGIFGRLLQAQSDAARRLFTPAAPPRGKQNLLSNDSSTWTNIGGTLTTGITAPDATTGAAQIANGILIVDPGGTISPVTGGYIIAAAWTSLVSGTTYGGGHPFQIDVAGTNRCDTNLDIPTADGTNASDGQWEYYVTVCKLVVADTTANKKFVMHAESQTEKLYAPALYYFTPSEITEDEAYEIGYNLSTNPTNCPAGASVCMMPGQKLGISGSTQFMGLLTHANTANRTYTFPDANAILPYVNGTLIPGNCLEGGPGTNEIADTGSACGSGGGGSGTVTSVAVGDLSPVFTSNVTNPTTAASVAYSLTNAAALKLFGNCTGSTAAPSYCSLTAAMLPATAALTTNPLSQFASTTSAQLAGVLSDETGTGVAVFGTSPTINSGNLVTPTIASFVNATHTHLTNATGGTLGGAIFSSSPTCTTAAGCALGSSALPFSNAHIGNAANQEFSFGTGTLSASRVVTVPNANTVIPVAITASSNNFLTGLDGTTGVFTRAQPAFTNLSGTLACAQMPILTGVIATAGGTCTTTGASITLETNGSNNTSQSTLNHVDSSGAGGLAWTNPSAGNVTASLANTAGGGTTALTGTLTSIATGDYIYYDGSKLANTPTGIVINPQTGTSYTWLTGDRGKAVTQSNGSASAYTLPQAGGTGFANNWFGALFNTGVGLVTITPTTSTINGASTQIVPQNWYGTVLSDNTNYKMPVLPSIAAFPNCTDTAGNHLNFTSATGAFGCGTSVATQASLLTSGNCSSSAAPAVCGSSSAGSVVIAAGATTVTVNTTAVTANSQIIIFPDETLGTKLSVTCNSTLATAASGLAITARTAATSFQISTVATIAVNPVCLSYVIVN